MKTLKLFMGFGLIDLSNFNDDNPRQFHYCLYNKQLEKPTTDLKQLITYFRFLIG